VRSGPRLVMDPDLMWLPVERDPALKVEPLVKGSVLKGKASYYGVSGRFRGRRTANGEIFDPEEFTGASNRFPLGSWLAVRRVGSEHCVVVWVNDRMHSRHKIRVVDVSLGAARRLQMLKAGLVDVEVRQLQGAPGVEPAICLQAFETPVVETPAGEPGQ